MKINLILHKGASNLQHVGVSNPQLEAEILLLTAIGQNRSRQWLIANPDFFINNETVKQFSNFVKRRMKFEPIAFITGHKEFYGYDFYVDNRVLIPRPESEILVEKSLALLCHSRAPFCHSREGGNPDPRFHGDKSESPIVVGDDIRVIELGTGSGCIIISIIKELQKQKIDLSKFAIVATDVSQDALDVARINAKKHGVDKLVQFVQSDLFDFLPATSYQLQPSADPPLAEKAKFDLILANLPYVPSYWIKDGPTEYGLIHEPKISLDGGPEGIDIYERFFKEVPKYLAPDGTILIECENDQIDKILKILKDLKYKFSHQVFRDYNNLQRVIQIDKIKT